MMILRTVEKTDSVYDDLIRDAKMLKKQINEINRKASQIVGRRVRILDEFYNGLITK